MKIGIVNTETGELAELDSAEVPYTAPEDWIGPPPDNSQDAIDALATKIGQTIGCSIDSTVSITPGIKNPVSVPFDCVIEGWNLSTDAEGSIQFDLWKDSGKKPTSVTQSICGTIKPQTSSADYGSGEDLDGWEVELQADDVILFVVDSSSLVTKATLTIRTRR